MRSVKPFPYGFVCSNHTPSTTYDPLVKMAKTPASQAGGAGFKSRRGHHIWGGGEDGESRRTVNPLPSGLEGSNPSLPTKYDPIVKLVKTPDFQSGSVGFKSHWGHHKKRLPQLSVGVFCCTNTKNVHKLD